MINQVKIQKQIEAIRAICQAEISAFENDSPVEQARRIARAKSDFEFFNETYFPNYSTCQPARFHKRIDGEIEKRDNDIIVVCAAREHGKTVRWGIEYLAWQIITQRRHFIMIISETEDMASERLINVRTHFEYNQRLIHDFGDMKGFTWTETEFVTRNSVKVEAKGYGQKVRGALFGPYRPDLIFVDDISSLKSARNEMLEKEKLEWISGELFGCMAGNGTLLWCENINRKTSAVAQCRENVKKGARIIFYHIPAIVNGKPVWPQRYDLEYFDKKKITVGNVVFEREYMQNPVTEGKFFKKEWFHRFSLKDVSALKRECEEIIIYLDPSYGKKTKTAKQRGSDKKVALVLGRSKLNTYLFDGISGQFSLETFCQNVCHLWEKWKTKVVWYEGNYGQDMIIGKFLDEASLSLNINLPRKPHYSSGHKEDRIEGLSPYAEKGSIYMITGNSAAEDVLDNLEGFPDLEFDDPADCFATGFQILEKSKTKVRARTGRR